MISNIEDDAYLQEWGLLRLGTPWNAYLYTDKPSILPPQWLAHSNVSPELPFDFTIGGPLEYTVNK